MKLAKFAGGLALAASALMSDPTADAQGAALSWGEAGRSALDQTIDAGEYGSVTSVLIRHGGETLYEGYFNGADRDTLHDTRSVTKTLTGMAVGLAIRDGVLGADTTPARYFTDLAPFENPSPAKLAITVEDLLTMSGPLECNDWNEFSRGHEERMYLVEDWSRFFWDLPLQGYPAWMQTPEDSPFGRSFRYCTAGVQLLGETVERATGEAFTTYMERELFAPLGIEQLEWPLNARGQAHMGGGLRLRARDLARLGELYLAGGLWQGEQVIPADWVATSLTPHADITDAPPGWLYGYLWWLVPYEVGGETYYAAAMNGNGGNRVFILPEWDLTVVFTNTDFNTPTMHRNAARFFEAEIVAHLQHQD